MENEYVPLVASDPGDDALLAARVSRLVGVAADLTALAAAADVLRRREIDCPLIDLSATLDWTSLRNRALVVLRAGRAGGPGSRIDGAQGRGSNRHRVGSHGDRL